VIAAWAVSIDDVYVYLRDEYAACHTLLTREIAALEADPPCPLPRMHLRRGAGAYICGEKSAIIESIEQARIPRLPAVRRAGRIVRPSTLSTTWRRFTGRELLKRRAVVRRPGPSRPQRLRSFSVSGRREPRRPSCAGRHHGARAIDEFAAAAGHELYGYLPGGASGGIYRPRSTMSRSISTRQPHGAFIGSAAVIVRRSTIARDAALN
jgi:formate dehydrogenase